MIKMIKIYDIVVVMLSKYEIWSKTEAEIILIYNGYKNKYVSYKGILYLIIT